MDSKHIGVVQKSISGERAVDGRTAESMAVLSERLERVKSLGGNYAAIAFSSAAAALASHRDAVAV